MDYAATTPMTKKALEAYVEVAQRYYGNSSSLHDLGGQAHYFIQQSREIIANELGVNSDGVIFTGSGTEGNIMAILSLALASKKGKHIISSQAEHTSVHAALNTLEKMGFEVTKLPLQKDGCIDSKQLLLAIRKDTALISIQHVNSEIGSIQPVEKIIEAAKESAVYCHIDCVQSFGKLTIPRGGDAMTISAHKIGGPKGCGAVYINPAIRVPALTPGVTHERGLRGGTLDTPSIVSFAAAVENNSYERQHYEELRRYFKSRLPKAGRLIECKQQLPNICGVMMSKVEGQYVLLKLNEAGISISTGSACDIHSESGTKAILSMNYSMEAARQFFRISFGDSTTFKEIDRLTMELATI
ncbi:cysteine desulfurase [Lysinibacillus fusiformis]|jgi:cysteine desulfurase|nr:MULTISPECIES: cysteine desulfurase family protein [Lysinibacillus]MCE4046870.1 cysteine desulfurase [Lysinibacillus fusiformis]MCT6817548.1 cysteine desulfurase [Lysinibacillus fusiformis]MCT6930728.1 cysteine desulfurase [Lysinibacillus fusiformis]MCT6935132.1 cysteine desulfurase [Lysinibacillus fusiformis]MDC6270632.1 cysteine desulfurase family protein [Lysinibacillus sphaericus]